MGEGRIKRVTILLKYLPRKEEKETGWD